jgi:hypothetical protein
MEKRIRDKNFGDVDFRQFNDRVLDITRPSGIAYPSAEDISLALNSQKELTNDQISDNINTPFE